MTNEEWERKVKFIVGQQAQFSADIQQLKELHTQAEARMTHIENIIVTAYEVTDAKINALAEDTTAKINALADSHIRLEDSLAHLAESQAKTDERLNVFINVVERYISEGRNGANKNQG